ncbi:MULTISPECIES: SDR family NAD(P)-dependent oxidoreductase [Bacillus cereus group]|uniref:SDR family NAD(P)-dependent oxidoreductase n=1 Tax=Bacillus cereus group TaxID=86661 RepID=UPI0001A1C6A7|nr:MULTISPECIES: SDR family NAD(P)-dependent oxidoreductase [Bacillus cereus group]EEM69056.1 hypothetical protein bthur0009_48270 [Bacillus thuringiensis serovar andalousiensis BGSC 4AW1]MEB9627245.1 SDR family NAD(P)-dependent oxidoreductase [Bacillus anthracis]OUA98267.1 short-chain dehydrogenase [Bacillus thuringiensis serovar oswaldocruzi]PEC08079.1 short-chain dehydrogenase [Bacillus toyonensis]
MKVAIVSGSGRGLGKEVCQQLGNLGFQVILTSRDYQLAKETASELSSKNMNVIGCGLDVTNTASVESMVKFVIDRYGKIDVLVNNAGVFLDNEINGTFSSIFENNINMLEETMQTNLYGSLRLIQACFPYMKKANYGRIVNVSSGMGRLTSMEFSKDGDIRRDARSGPFYRISKTALNALTRIVAAEAYGYNILVNSVCPGWVKTDMGGENAIRSLNEGARSIVWAATLNDDGPSGGFFRDSERLQW